MAEAKKVPAKKAVPAKASESKPVAEKAHVEKGSVEKVAPQINHTGDPMRDRFLEALAKKQGHGPNLGTGPSGAGSVRGSQSEASKPQMFRRKSGG